MGQSRKAKIVIAPCPPKRLWADSPWQAYGKEKIVEYWVLPDANYRDLGQWIRDWQTCAEGRGAALEEVNK